MHSEKGHEAKYLGVTLTEERVSDSKMVERIKKGKNVLGVLRRLGVFTNGVHPAQSIRLPYFRGVLSPLVWEGGTGLHLKPK